MLKGHGSKNAFLHAEVKQLENTNIEGSRQHLRKLNGKTCPVGRATSFIFVSGRGWALKQDFLHSEVYLHSTFNLH